MPETTISKKELQELVASITSDVIEATKDRGLTNDQINKRIFNKVKKLVEAGDVDGYDAFFALLPKMIESGRKSYVRAHGVQEAISKSNKIGDMFSCEVGDSLIDAGGITIRTGAAQEAIINDKNDAVTDNLVKVTNKHATWTEWYRPVRDYLRDHPGSVVDDALAVLSARNEKS